MERQQENLFPSFMNIELDQVTKKTCNRKNGRLVMHPAL
jgi:hypothetical protein